MPEKFEQHISINEDGRTALDWLSDHVDLSRQKLRKVMSNGAVWLENSAEPSRLRRAKKILAKGCQLHIYYDANIQEQQAPAPHLIEDLGEYSVWDKPSGLLSQGSKWGDQCTLYRWAETHLQPQRTAFIVHRLDRAANGLMLLAHSRRMARCLSRMFEMREVKKTYCALVEGKVSLPSLPLQLTTPVNGKEALSVISGTEYEDDSGFTRLRISIETGRKHQIRQQLAELGYPIRGDRLYGAKDISVDLQLTSSELEMVCPLSNEQKKWVLPRSQSVCPR